MVPLNKTRRVNIRPHFEGLAVLVFLLSAPSTALAAEQGAAGWIGVKLRVPFAERCSFQMLTQPRFFENPDSLRILFVSPWFDVALPHGFGVGLGYEGLFFFRAVERQEHRIWQAVTHRHAWEHLRTLLRIRLSQRFLSDRRRVSVRGRFLLGFAVPLGLDIDFLLSNEFFVNFNDVEFFGIQGYAQNHLFGGFGRRFTPWVEAAIGYQMQWVKLGVVFINHTVVVSVGFQVVRRSQ